MCTMGSLRHFLLFTAAVIAVSSAVTAAHNITAILEGHPEYSQFNDYLSRTKLADEINTRTTVTVLVLTNGAFSSVTSKHPLSVIKNVLELHVLLDYWDGDKLHDISKGTTLSTTLYQTTGNAPGNLGFVNITDQKGGKVGFGSALPGSPLASQYTKSVKQIPFNISVIEINTPIVVPAVLNAPAPAASDYNLTGALEKAGCKTFASLLISSGVIKTFEKAADKGLTIFAPNDEAFKADSLPDLSKLSNADTVALLEYHAVAEYTPFGTLKTSKDPISTLAANGAGKFDFSTETSGDSVTLHTGVDSSRVASTVIDSTPLCIFTVDKVLLPAELFGNAPSPAPGPAPEISPAPAPESDAPSPSAEASAPSPLLSPPAPPTSSPGGAPADSPTADSENTTASKNSGAVNAPALLLLALLALSVYLS
ncbi:fasciclin-like arabinogalactan protein 8 [Ipomoea triloba]|uniref:fasciclin-like arabinogalactan protein 8 n=1 Tax=Ipomoea triloba TaxID=35885 RepID=UPI00125DC19D|nr:fasciclin-like arabinogalactan protein 8 [Ipomoea triloba]